MAPPDDHSGNGAIPPEPPTGNGAAPPEQSKKKLGPTEGLRPYRKGEYTKGRQKGVKNRATLVLQKLLDGEAGTITRKCIDMAKAGNETCIRLVLERVMPPMKDRPVNLDLPEITNALTAMQALTKIVDGAAKGEVTPIEAIRLTQVVATVLSFSSVQSFDERLARLEAGADRSIEYAPCDDVASAFDDISDTITEEE